MSRDSLVGLNSLTSKSSHPPFINVETILRLRQVLQATGRGKTSLYADIQRGVFTKPVRVGPGCVGWPASEVNAVNHAKIAGKTDPEIRELVDLMHAERTKYRAL